MTCWKCLDCWKRECVCLKIIDFSLFQLVSLKRQSRFFAIIVDSIQFFPFSSHRRNDLLAVSVSSRTLHLCEFHKTCQSEERVV